MDDRPEPARDGAAAAEPPWFVYILECRDGSFYTGITNNLEQRIIDHNRGKGCRYTKFRWPVKLLYSEQLPDRSSALKREAQIQAGIEERR